MSIRPWPLRLKRITSSRPSSLALRAARMVAAIAWVDSGAGMIPSARAKRIPALRAVVLNSTGTLTKRPILKIPNPASLLVSPVKTAFSKSALQSMVRL